MDSDTRMENGVTVRNNILYGPPYETYADISVSQYLLQYLRAEPDHVVLIDAVSGTTITNGELLEQSVKLTEILKRRGIKMGDKIAIASENRLNWLVPTLAGLFIGATVAPFNPAYTKYEITHILNIGKPKIIFVSERTEQLLSETITTLPWRIELIQLSDRTLTGNVPVLRDLLKAVDLYPDPYHYVPDHIGDTATQEAFILCSSGTTGLPKGVLLSHRTFVYFIRVFTSYKYINIQRGDKILLYQPFYHGYAVGVLSMTVAARATAIVMHTFDPEVLFSSIEKYHITHLPLVPTLMAVIVKHPSSAKYNLNSVREVICGGAPMPKKLIPTLKKRLNVKSVRNVYGMTELTIASIMSDRSGNNDGYLNYIVPGTELKVIDTKSHETLGPEQVGEICIRGKDVVMMGYCNNPQATQETIDKDGWLHTGDLGFYDQQGRLTVIDRLKELIKYNAYQVAPAEIEVVILSHPGVKDVAVIGVPNEISGEVPLALVVRQPGATVTEEEIVQLVRQGLSPQKWLRGGVKFVDAIPKNPTGKILRREIRELVSKL